MKEEYSLSHLKELEAESIYIIREVASEFENPVMLYSIGKDSSVMVRLAEKAFAPGKPPFPLMHIDSKWKFKEMLKFRDEYAAAHGWKLIVESNMEAFRAGVGPFTHGSKVHTDCMRSTNTVSTRPLAVRAAMKRRAAPRNVSFPSATVFINGTPRTSARSYGIFTTPAFIKAKAFVCSP